MSFLSYLRAGFTFPSTCIRTLWENGHRSTASILAAVIAYLTALLISFPGTLLHRSFYHMRMFDTLKLSKDLFARNLDEAITAYRLTIPVLIKALHLESPAAITLVFQVFPSIAALALLFFNVSKRLDPRKAWPVTLMFALSFLVFWTFYYGGIFDSMTHLCLALLMTIANPWIGFGISIVGVFNDERFIIAAPFAILWHYQGGDLRSAISQIWKPTLGFSLGILISLFLRRLLTIGIIGPGIETPDVYQKIWTDSIQVARPYATKSFFVGWAVFTLSLFMSFRWIWIPFIQFFQIRSSSYFRGFKTIFLTSFLLCVLSTAIVMDVAKSIGFLFPGVLFCVVSWIKLKQGTADILPTLWRIVVCLIITPVFCINGNVPAFWLPLPIEALRIGAIYWWDFDIVRDFLLHYVHSDAIFPPIEIYQNGIDPGR